MRKESCISGTIPGWIRRLAPVLVAVCLTSCIKDRIPQGADLEAGDRLPEFSVTMDDGSTISTADMLGGISCIVFFHTGCPDCQKTLPLIQQLYDRYSVSEQTSGNNTISDEAGSNTVPDIAAGQVRFLCISREEDAGSVEEYWTEHGYTMPYSAQESREIYNLFATYAVPRIYISDIDGVIRSIWTDNPLPTFDELETALLDAMPFGMNPNEFQKKMADQPS